CARGCVCCECGSPCVKNRASSFWLSVPEGRAHFLWPPFECLRMGCIIVHNPPSLRLNCFLIVSHSQYYCVSLALCVCVCVCVHVRVCVCVCVCLCVCVCVNV